MPRHRLTDEQKRVVASNASLIFVEAVPGSGKTTVAVERFGVLRHARYGADPRGVRAVSFARSAVAELRRRVHSRWGGRTATMPNNVSTMDGLYRDVVEFLLRTDRIRWPGGIVMPRLIDSWARQRGASRISVSGPRNQRWEFALNGITLAVAYRAVDSPCWGMLFAQKADYTDSLREGICTHDEVRQLVGLALGRPELRDAIGDYLSRSIAHLIVDEAFDLNGLDALLVRRAIESGVGVTLVGDPWQALYEWRGARPDMVHRLLHDYSFRTLPMHKSFRFRTAQTGDLERRLREGLGVAITGSSGTADVVLASEWDHLLGAGLDVIPLSFGQLDCQTDASIILLLDEVARSRLGKGALNVTEALRCLRRDEGSVDLAPVLTMLRDASVAREDVMNELRDATKVEGRRRPSLPAVRVGSRLARLSLLRDWLTVDRRYVEGLSVHQAKGREWPRVDVVLDATARTILDAGLDGTREDHRKLYVALTRGSESTAMRAI
jgi:DNA helicase-2/ATP-dependent DNA helicase PcrA